MASRLCSTAARVDGTWTLVPAAMDGDPKNWLLLRKRDDSSAPRGNDRTAYAPMLATPSETLPKGNGWLYEVKWDGYRAICLMREGEAMLSSRAGNDLTGRFDAVARALPRALRTPACVVDGEVCALDDEGRPSFAAMQQGAGTLVIYLFDLLEVEGTPVLDLPLTERRERLRELVDVSNGIVRLSETFEDGDRLKAAVEEQGLEGVLAKRADSHYQPGKRTRDWLKIKVRQSQELIIVGYTRGEGRRASTLGALVLAVRRGNELVWAGNCGTGFTEAEIERLLKRLRPLERAESPLAVVPRMARVKKGDVVWVAPELVCEVEFAEWTREGRLRAPVYKGLRDDKEPEEVRREQPFESEIKRGRRVLRLSNADKVFWPDEGITKGDLLEYYRARRTGARSAPARPAVHDEALSRRHRRQVLLPEGRAVAHARLDQDRVAAGHDARRQGQAHHPLPARQRRARAALGREHGDDRHERDVVPGGQSPPAGCRAVRSRSCSARRDSGRP